MTALALQFDPFFDATTIELCESSGGKYLGITLSITATNNLTLWFDWTAHNPTYEVSTSALLAVCRSARRAL